MTSIESPIGVIAGNGIYPIDVVREAKKRGHQVIVVAHRNEADPVLESLADHCHWVHVGQLGRIIRTLKRYGVKSACFAGGIRRINFFGALKLDWRGIKLATRLASVRDDSLLSGIAAEFESEGMTVFSAGDLLEDAIPSKGYITTRQMSDGELADARVGWEAAKGIGALDIGQTVVTCQRLVIAVEAIEGTDATLKRAGDMASRSGKMRKSKSGPVVVKLSKPQQDLRMDLPAIGPETIVTMKEANLQALVIEAGKCLLLDPDTLITAANEAGISIMACESLEDLAGPDVLSNG